MDRLSLATLPRLRGGILRPRFDPAGLAPGIVHLGIGAFHRGHMARYTQGAVERAGGAWGIVGVSLRGAGVRDALLPQDCLYTLVERDAEGERLGVIGVVRDVLHAPAAPEAVLARIADPATRIVSLTVTEKGYCHDPASGRLDDGHPDIVHDLAEPQRPRSAAGFLAEGLARRRAAGAPPLTVLCCDNLPSNGRTVEGIVQAFAALRGLRLDGAATFPSTMVDRIVPATTPEDVALVEQRLGLHDAAPVMAEPFIQWVIEDRFAGPRPAWEGEGLSFVSDVAPFEEMKLRLLNASHSALAYLGYLAGHAYIFETMRDADLRRFVRAMMDEEVTPSLHVPGTVDLDAYKDALIARFSNPVLRHRTYQIAMDGSQKLPQRLLGTVRDNLAAGRPVGRLALAVAGWMRYATGRDESGAAIAVQDPLAARLAAIGEAHRGDSAAMGRAYLSVTEIFGADLRAAAPFADAVAANLQALHARGVRSVLAGA